MKISLVAGRNFSESDDHSGTPVVIVNQEFARQFFPGEDPLGKRFRVPAPRDRAPAPWKTIVGVVADVHHLGLEEKVRPELYDRLADSHIYDSATFVIRTPEIE